MLNKIEWVDGDITDVYSVLEAMKDIKQVYHCAAFVSFHPRDYKQMFKVNVEGTANIVNMAMEKGIDKFCHVSSVAAIGRSDENNHISENSPWKASKQNSNYAISKYAGEQEVWRGITEGLNAVIVNPSMVLGPGNLNNGSTELFGGVLKGLKFYSEGINGFVDVRDVTKSMMQLMARNISGERYIISSENISYNDLFFEIADAFGKARPSIKVNKWMSEAAWRIEALRTFFTRGKPFVTKETAQSSQYQWFYTNEKIKKETGIDFIPVKESIKNNCDMLIKS